MSTHPLPILAAAAFVLASCEPPPPVPPPRFTPNPPGPPAPVDPYGQPVDPYGQTNPGPDPYRQPPENPDMQPAPVRPGDYPLARRTANPNQVISPYEPYNVIDVEGFKSGELARDPSNKKIFRVP